MTEERQRRNEEEEAPLQKAYLIAKIGADTAENEQHFAETLPIGRKNRAVRTQETNRRYTKNKNHRRPT